MPANDGTGREIPRRQEQPMVEMITPYSDAGAADQIVAATRRWLERAVIGLNLCPFAKSVHVKQQIRYAVTAAETADELLAELVHELETLAHADPATLETTLLIHPRAMADFIDYHFFLGEADAAVRKLGLEGVLQIASFHPHYDT
jgi:hypothetical protein